VVTARTDRSPTLGTGCFHDVGGVLAAGNPGREFLPAPPDIVGPFCGDAVGDIVAHVAVQREYIKTFTSSNGVVR
jgi:hypothetical protein